MKKEELRLRKRGRWYSLDDMNWYQSMEKMKEAYSAYREEKWYKEMFNDAP